MHRSLLISAAFLLSVLLSSCGNGGEKTYPGHELVKDLISRIDSAEVYRSQKEAELEELKQQLASTDASSREWLTLCNSLAEGYSNYITDSAIVYCNKAITRAQILDEKDLYLNATLKKIRFLNRTGYFAESGLIINSIKPTDFSEEKRWQFYSIYADYYHSLYNSTPRESEYRSLFTDKYNAYRDTLITMLPPDNDIVLRETEKKAARDRNIDEALRINDQRFEKLSKNSTNKERALMLYDRYAIYHYYMKRPIGDHVEYILESAICDVVSANQNIASLRYVEAYLISVGDIYSAKIVSDYYYSAMLRYGSKTRLLDAMDINMRTNNEYSRMLTRQKRMIQASLLGIILLLIIILLILRVVLASRHHIAELNKDLERSSKTALSYVLGFFNLYSSYLSRLLSLRSKINVNARRGNYDNVLALTDPSKDITAEELKGMYAYFDSAFLDICPDYVDKFNALLRPECQIRPKSDEKLTMELRIFAIIKLGITDSAKISELLHCSIKTVYNKRSEINQKLAVDRDVFMEKLLDI